MDTIPSITRLMNRKQLEKFKHLAIKHEQSNLRDFHPTERLVMREFKINNSEKHTGYL